MQLVCFQEHAETLRESNEVSAAGQTQNSNGETCCVAKTTKPFGAVWPHQSMHAKLF